MLYRSGQLSRVALSDNGWVIVPLDLGSWSCAVARRSAAMLVTGALMAAVAAPAAAQQSVPGGLTESPEPSEASRAAQEPDEPVPGVSDEQVQDLISTLEDPARRQELIDTLQGIWRPGPTPRRVRRRSPTIR
jgi:hypothetical protein